MLRNYLVSFLVGIVLAWLVIVTMGMLAATLVPHELLDAFKPRLALRFSSA